MRTVPFVGRQPEMRLLAAELVRSRRGARMVLVTGEAGVGKTRLLQEFASHHRRDADVLVARGSPASTASPFSIVVEAIESRLRRLPAARLTELARDRRADVATLLPTLADAFDGPRPRPTRFRILDGFRSILEQLAAARALVLLLDDLHQADRSSWEVVNYLARNPPSNPVLLVAAVRSDELFGVPPLTSLIATLLKDGLAEHVRLEPLDPQTVAKLVRRMLPPDAGRDTAEWLYARARGNALYTVALLDELSKDVTRRVVPIDVQEGVRITVAGLPARSRDVLELAAVMGSSFAVNSIMPFVPEARAEDLDRLARLGLLVERPDAGLPSYEFAHPLVQEAVYAGIGPARRRELHQSLAKSLPPGPSSSRAYHAGLGAVPGDMTAVELLRAAAREAELDEAHRDALVHLERALAIVPASASPLRRELLDEIAWQAAAAGDHLTGIRALRSLAPLVAHDEEEAARTDVRLSSFLATGAGDLPAAERHAGRAVRLLSKRPPGATLAAALNELAWVRGEAGRLSEQIVGSRQAAELAREVGADEVRMHALGCLGHALALAGESDEAISVLTESLNLARLADDGGQAGWHTGALATALLLSGRAVEAGELLDHLLAGRANTSDVAYFSRAHINWHLGRWDAAVADVRMVQALNPGVASVHSAWALSLGGAVLAAQGDVDQARSFVAQAERIYARRPFYCFSAWHDWATGHALWFEGDHAGAESRFGAALTSLDSMGARAAADLVRPDLWQVTRTLGRAAPAAGDGSPLRRAREYELAGDLAESARVYATLPAPYPERRALALLRARGPVGRRAAQRAGSLTERERLVARLAAAGLTDREIAGRLHVADRTVETHLAHVYAKLGIRGRGELRTAGAPSLSAELP